MILVVNKIIKAFTPAAIQFDEFKAIFGKYFRFLLIFLDTS